MSLQTTAMLVKKLLVDDNIQLVTNKCVSWEFKGRTEKHCLMILGNVCYQY